MQLLHRKQFCTEKSCVATSPTSNNSNEYVSTASLQKPLPAWASTTPIHNANAQHQCRCSKLQTNPGPHVPICKFKLCPFICSYYRGFVSIPTLWTSFFIFTFIYSRQTFLKTLHAIEFYTLFIH